MNLLCVILILVALQGAYSSVKNSPCYHSCACPDSITLETSSVCMCPYDCKVNQAPLLNQVVDQDATSLAAKPEPRHLTSWAAQLCGIAAMIVLQLATME
jgi:hypothetical protein